MMVNNEKCVMIAKTIDDFDIMLETFGEKSSDFVCIICMYESDNDSDKEMEKILERKLKRNKDIGEQTDINDNSNSTRYCKIKTSHSYLCNHSFHTACVHEWFLKSKSIKCPLCQQELELSENQIIHSIFMEEPKLVRTTYDFQGGLKTTCEEYYTLYGKKEGKYTCYGITGHKFKECMYQNDLKHGIEFEYFPDSTIKSMHTYSKGKKNGKFWVKSYEGWYIIKGEYENNKFKGTIRRWDEKSRILIFSCWYSRGKKHGPEITWYSKNFTLENPSKQYRCNQIKSYTVYNNGVLNGFELLYSYKGLLVKKAHYLNGILHGRYIENYECGSKKCESVYLMGTLIGTLKKWYSPQTHELQMPQTYEQTPLTQTSCETTPIKHKLSAQRPQMSCLEHYTRHNGKTAKDGLCIEWHKNGVIKRYMPYMFGKLHGTAIYQNENGKPMEICDYKDGNPHGYYWLYYNNLTFWEKMEKNDNDEIQKLHWIMPFNEGVLNGKCIEYNTRGTPKLEMEYENGVLKTMHT